MESQFLPENNVNIIPTGDNYSILIAEKIVLHGKPLTTSPEDYPLVQAAKWAQDQTSNADIMGRLQQYLASISKGVEESVRDGVMIEFSVIHDMEISFEDGQVKILKDEFSDRNNDNREGFDNINWKGDYFTRQKPDWQKMLDYEIYVIPVEIIGQQLLDDFSRIATELTSSHNYFSNRDYAVWYIREYTSNPDYYHYISCAPEPSVLQDTDFYNLEYYDIWSEIGCYDCADFVSQALKYGGYPEDTDWQSSIDNIYWVRPYRLGIYFDTIINRGSFVDNLSSLQVGDLAFIRVNDFGEEDSNWIHSVMVSKINPHRYSGHTNDRLNYAFSPDFNRFLVVMYEQYVYMPFIIKNDGFSYLQGNNEQILHPTAIKYQDTSSLPPYPGP